MWIIEAKRCEVKHVCFMCFSHVTSCASNRFTFSCALAHVKHSHIVASMVSGSLSDIKWLNCLGWLPLITFEEVHPKPIYNM